MYLGLRTSGVAQTVPLMAVESILFSGFCLTSVIAGIALFQGWIDSGERVWRTLAANSFGIYYLHPLILYPLAYLLVGLSAPSLLKVTFLVVATLFASLAVNALILKRLPGLRKAF